MKFNAETQKLRLKKPAYAPVTNNSYGKGVYAPGTVPQKLVDKYENDIELVEEIDVEIEKKGGIVEVNNVKTIPVERKVDVPEPKPEEVTVNYNKAPDPIKTTNTRRGKSLI